jgi:hypothetical protein
MGAEAIVSFISSLVTAVPQMVNDIRAGKDPANIKLGDYLSTDALDRVRKANAKASDYIEGGS